MIEEKVNAAFITEVLEKYPIPMLPPGCITEIVLQPNDPDAAMEIGIVQEHRFAFFYWLKWRHKQQLKNKKAVPPNLVTVDWHYDVGAMCDFFPDVITKLDYSNLAELALFSWCGLRSLNDGHIAPAMFLNAINDVYVILKQHGHFETGEPITDRYGNPHLVHYYYSVEEFLDEHGRDTVHPCIFDLDLDYFTENKGARFPDVATQNLVTNQLISAFFKDDSPFMQWLFSRMCGMTVALEPEYCGGMHNCLRIFNVMSSCLFDPSLLSVRSKWKHLNYR